MFCDGVQADIGGDMLIDDLHTSIMQQAAFDAVVRVRTSTGKSLMYDAVALALKLLLYLAYVFTVLSPSNMSKH